MSKNANFMNEFQEEEKKMSKDCEIRSQILPKDYRRGRGGMQILSKGHRKDV